MSGTAVLRPTAGEHEWDRLAQANGGTPFVRYAFLEAMREGLGVGLDLRVVDVEAEPVGVVPLIRAAAGPACVVNWMPFPFVGPLVPRRHLEETLKSLARWARRHRCLRQRHWLDYQLAEGEYQGYQVVDDTTLVVAVRGKTDEEILSAMARHRRQLIAKARGLGVVIERSSRDDVTVELPRMLAETFVRQSIPSPYDGGCLAAFWDLLGSDEDVLCESARVDGKLVAAAVGLAGFERAVGWVNGRVDGEIGSAAAAELIRRAISWSRDRGCHEFDLVGAPTEGIARYKRGFGAVERPLSILYRNASAERLRRRLLGRPQF